MATGRSMTRATNTVSAARDRFFSEREAPGELVSSTILQSWLRCAQLGHDAGRAPSVAPVSARDLREIREQHETLLHLSRAEIEALRREIRATGNIVILADPTGVVLDSGGDASFANKATRLALSPGVDWSEASIGTNAIGTALYDGCPVTVIGGEHFHEFHGGLGCTAAPIFSPVGAIVGAIDMSGNPSTISQHCFSMVCLLADRIEHRLFNHTLDRMAGARERDILRFHADPALLGTAREGILVFEGERLVAANRHALRSVSRDWSALGHASFDSLFEGGMKSLRREGTLHALAGGVVHYRLPRGGAGAPVALRGGTSLPGARPAPAEPATVVPWPEPMFDARTLANIGNAVRLVSADVPLLINGETGSGKEAFARAVHAGSRFADMPFVAVNCAAIPESLIESELFGYEEGAFTGARRHGSRGLLREADGGILFLDEIGDMPLALQSRLLRVLQDRQVVPLGGGRPVPVNIRLISATHRDIEALSRQGQFRSDLFYRLAQFSITLDPLRKRGDLPSLIDNLWRQVTSGSTPLAEEIRRRMEAYDWPGNYRELVGALRALAALAMAGVQPGPNLLPVALRGFQGEAGAAQPAETGSLHRHAHAMMREALEASGGNVSLAARRLGINRSTLYRHLRRLQ
ncbi:MAG: sigma-54-dependent Fis family transcriptional regulator [Pseudochelatococcus sp.]|jgi:transcriptional regulator of acetoin/glycerol metabolism|uniref:sigma-54-dependent Fis family transcriptional regulator n=1 Tax=Pseudochelatococcus sp. TaxID=2020869 RepID=UPI003D8BC2DA